MTLVRRTYYTATQELASASSACWLRALIPHETTNQTRWIQLFEQTGGVQPPNGTVPIVSVKYSANDLGIYQPPGPVMFTNGCWLSISSTINTLTLDAASPFWVELWLEGTVI